MNYIKVSEEDVNKHGAYLYYDSNDEKWIRSGKVTGRSFATRDHEHKKKASAKFLSSKFYRRYPSQNRHTTSGSTAGRKGNFENLVQYIALGFEIGNDQVEKLITATEGDNIFAFDDTDIKNIKKLNSRGRLTWEAKAIDMIAYLIELAFDVGISVIDNVSENPGFEGCHGVW